MGAERVVDERVVVDAGVDEESPLGIARGGAEVVDPVGSNVEGGDLSLIAVWRERVGSEREERGEGGMNRAWRRRTTWRRLRALKQGSVMSAPKMMPLPQRDDVPIAPPQLFGSKIVLIYASGDCLVRWRHITSHQSTFDACMRDRC